MKRNVGTRTVVAGALWMCSGCSPKVDDCEQPVPVRTCTPDGGSSAGCSFIATRQLHLVDALSDLVGVPRDERNPDAVLLANPAVDEHVELELFEVDAERGCEVRLRDPVVLQPGEIEVIELRSPSTADLRTRRRRGAMIRVDADRPVSGYLFGPYRPFVGNDSSMLLPEHALGTKYVVASYLPHPEHIQGVGEPTYFDVIATEDRTTVRWLPARGPTAGDGDEIPEVPAGQWSPEVELDRYEAARVTAVIDPSLPASQLDVSGTVVEASAPVAVFAGSRCSGVPRDPGPMGGCDPLQEQMLPVQLWGTQYVVPHPPLRTDELHYYRVYGAVGGSSVRIDAPELGEQSFSFAEDGSFIEVVVPHGVSFSVDADGPVLPVGYLTTRDPDPQIGDPAMYQIVPTDRFDDRYVFATGVDWEVHLLQVVRAAGGAEVMLDGAIVQGWEAAGDHEVAVVEVAEGVHVVEAAQPFGATLFGWTNMVHEQCTRYAGQGTCQTSYAHPVGLRTDP